MSWKIPELLLFLQLMSILNWGTMHQCECTHAFSKYLSVLHVFFYKYFLENKSFYSKQFGF